MKTLKYLAIPALMGVLMGSAFAIPGDAIKVETKPAIAGETQTTVIKGIGNKQNVMVRSKQNVMVERKLSPYVRGIALKQISIHFAQGNQLKSKPARQNIARFGGVVWKQNFKGGYATFTTAFNKQGKRTIYFVGPKGNLLSKSIQIRQ